ncbi:uncharacterized protein PG998_010051 [Apiospora kogelbergensis]|uniref:uncharacterized protein n=1 Tax=Apiospora kogelbergensis TaxID=1337665 RepID=UPI00312FAAC5
MVNVLVLGSALVAVTLLYSVAGLYTNYQKVRRSGIPIIISPFYTFNPLWIIAQSWFAPRKWFLPLCRLLPEPFSLFTRVVLMDWPKEDGCELHDKFGPAFWVISPGTVQFVCSDPVANEEIMSKYKVWTKPPEHVAALAMYGPNVLTVEGEDWTRHKRIIGPCFNERTSVFVWEETMRQVQEMLDKRVFADPDHTHKTLCEDSRTIALHSFMGVGLGAPQDFSTGARQKSDGRRFSFRDSLTSVLHELVLTMIASQLPPAILKYLPKYMSEKKVAFDEAGQYIEDLVKKQEDAGAQDSGAADKKRTTFLATLVSNARDDATAAEGKTAEGNRKRGFSKQDLMGNMFVMSFAGHDTTASSLAFTMTMLATRPDYQRWIQEEIDTVLALGIDRGDYKNLFPKLKRCQALMFETLRLYHPALLVTRQTSTPNQLSVALSPGTNEKTVIQVPAGTLVHANLHTTYLSPKLWGADCAEWKPERYIIPAGTDKPGWPEYRPEPAGQTAEKLVAPPLALSSFWSLGPRICLGMKFSQVEFTVAMFTAFSQARVDPVPRPEVVARASSAEAAVQEARVELRGVLDRSGFGTTGPLLHITEPEKIVLRWYKR